ncbi:MAG: hypothetical protein KAV00_17960 [Phycisphaerae bacterium]|nr:hypothetical protein [Phycisphaerae bacterium]
MKYRLDDGQIEVVDDAEAEVLRRMTSAQRVAMVFRLNRRLRIAVEGNIRSCHPDWDDEQVREEVLWRFHDRTRRHPAKSH